MRILGIDPGTKCGFAVWDNGAIVASGTWDLSPRRFEGGGMRYLRFERLFAEARLGVDLVAFEEVRRHLGTDAAHIYGGIVAVLAKTCEEAGTPYHGVPVGTVKKFATGRGCAKKPDMLEAARRKWGDEAVAGADDNEIDARWIAEAAAAERG